MIFVGKNLYFYCKINWGFTEEAQSALFLEAAHRLYFFMPAVVASSLGMTTFT